MFKKLNSFYFKLTILTFVVIYFANILDLEYLYQEFKKIQNSYFFLSWIIFLPNTALFILKWFFIIQKFHKQKFFDLYYKLSKSIILSEIFQNSLVIDASKFYYLKKVNFKTKLILIINDKLITLLAKLFFIFFIVFALFIFYSSTISNHININININYLIILSLFLIILLLLLRGYITNYYQKYLSSEIIPRKKILIIELLRNFLMSGVYYLSFIQFSDLNTAIIFAIFSPIIETALRFQIISSIGMREFIIFTAGTTIGLDQNIIISSIFITFVTFMASCNNYLISTLLKYFKYK